MSMQINAGSMRHIIQWFKNDGDATDDWGKPIDPVAVGSQLMANVQVKSGTQTASLGLALTEEVITIMTWYDDSVTNDMLVLWNGIYYEIQHIKPDELLRGMIVTAKAQRNG